MNSNNNELFIYNKNTVIDIISCPICLEYYKHPRNLKCGHSFCTTCLHLIKIKNEIVCPLCRTITKFDKDFTLVDLSVNTILISMIDNTNNNFNDNFNNNFNNNLSDNLNDSFDTFNDEFNSEFNNNLNNNRLKCKRSKSLDVISNNKIARKKKILHQHNIANEKILNVSICTDKISECCTFQ